MFVDFDEVFNKELGEIAKIPEPLLAYLSKELPQGLKYISDQTGNCIIVSNDESELRLSVFSLAPTSEQKKVLGEDATVAEILD